MTTIRRPPSLLQSHEIPSGLSQELQAQLRAALERTDKAKERGGEIKGHAAARARVKGAECAKSGYGCLFWLAADQRLWKKFKALGGKTGGQTGESFLGVFLGQKSAGEMVGYIESLGYRVLWHKAEKP